MDLFKFDEFQPFIEIIRNSRPIIRKVLVTKKWNVEILYELEIHKGLTFNDIARHLEKISSRTLSDCLKQLQELGLITRTVQDTRPPSVLYELSNKGKGFVELSLILIYYLSDIPVKK